jgi:oligopeptide/dipeptide ABC transporter ATP-binding protein
MREGIDVPFLDRAARHSLHPPRGPAGANVSPTPLLAISGLTVDFLLGSRLSARIRGAQVPVLRALDDVSLVVNKGEAVGLVGESGAGKSTLAQVVVGLREPTRGHVRLNGSELGTKRPGPIRRRIQMVFQDPGSSLNPLLSIEQTLSGPLRYHRLCEPAECRSRCAELLELVGLSASTLELRPSSLSGGQRQRVALARSLAVEPEILIADEAVSALDVSVQASILALLNRLRHELGLTTIFVSHDLAVVRQVSSRVVVLYLGAVVEDRPTESLFDDPQHPYTRALMDAAPKLGVRKEPGSAALGGELPSAVDRPSGCRFRTRCPLAQPVCAELEPELWGPGDHGTAACHFAWPAHKALRQDPVPRQSSGPTSTLA